MVGNELLKDRMKSTGKLVCFIKYYIYNQYIMQ